MKKIILIISITFFTFIGVSAQKTFHDFKTQTLTGEEFDFASLKGKKILVVNTASKCGFTPQYEGLEALYQQYKDNNFVVIGFPANNFGNQEPGSNEEIAQFCEINYGVTFPMMQKLSVKGDDQHPIYSWLTNKSENGTMDSNVKWNFTKFMIDEEGKLVDVLSSMVKPDSDKITKWIEGTNTL